MVTTSGRKLWRFMCYYLGKEKRFSLGSYEIVSLAKAREKRIEAKKLLADGTDPSTDKKQGKREAIRNANNSFEAVAREWHTKKCEIWVEKTGAKIMRYLEKDVFPQIGSRPIADIDPPEVDVATLFRTENV